MKTAFILVVITLLSGQSKYDPVEVFDGVEQCEAKGEAMIAERAGILKRKGLAGTVWYRCEEARGLAAK